MQFPSWLHDFTSRYSLARAGHAERRTPRRRPAARPLQVELLEDRFCPSSYAITDLGTLGGTGSRAEAINNLGQVAGGASTGVGDFHAFLWTPGASNGVPSNPQMQDLGTLPGLPLSEAIALNNGGQVVGRASVDFYHTGDHGFLWNGTTMTDLGTLGGGLSGINPTVSVATTTPGAFPSTHAVQTITFGGNITSGNFTLTFSGATTAAIAWSSNATTLAANIQAGLSPLVPATVTASSPTTDTVTFPYPGPEPTMTAATSYSNTIAYAVNNATAAHPVQVVGRSSAGPGVSGLHAFLWESGAITDLNSLLPANSGWFLATATGINDNQQIVGGGYHNGMPRAFIWQIGSSVVTELASTFLPLPRAVNAVAQVTGGPNPYLWTNGTITSLPLLPGTTWALPLALNSASSVQVVGYAGPGHAVLWQNGKVIDLTTQIPTTAKWSQLDVAYGINDTGRIVGAGHIASGAYHAFLLTPSKKTTAVMGSTSPATTPAITLTAIPPAVAFSPSSASAITPDLKPGRWLDQPQTSLATDINSGRPNMLPKANTRLPERQGPAARDRVFAGLGAGASGDLPWENLPWEDLTLDPVN